MNTTPVDTLLLAGIICCLLAMLVLLVYSEWRHR